MVFFGAMNESKHSFHPAARRLTLAKKLIQYETFPLPCPPAYSHNSYRALHLQM